jgi:hypothetical protein
VVLVRAEFQSANPRNRLRLGDTFFKIEKKQSKSPTLVTGEPASARGAGIGSDDDDDDDEWVIVRNDASLDTRFLWRRPRKLSAESIVTVEWRMAAGTTGPGMVEPGEYRIVHFGTHKSLIHGLQDFKGVTASFHVE